MSLPARKAGREGFFSIFKKRYGFELVPFASARSAMVFAARALGLGRNTEILIPPWLGHCVLSAISRVITPSLHFSPLTRSILVYHQFGFPQDMQAIGKLAREYDLRILNDCANTLFSKDEGRSILEWGDATVVSLAKLYPAGMGGALFSQHPDVIRQIYEKYPDESAATREFSDAALATLVRADNYHRSLKESMDIEAVFGSLPEMVAMARAAFAGLPASATEIETDIQHRMEIRDIVFKFFPEQVPQSDAVGTVPFAIPVRITKPTIQTKFNSVAEKLGVELPILHFDFNMNMLNPNYQKAIIIGCHAGWTTDLVQTICSEIVTL